MQYYFAPMEGITDTIYRKLHHQYFGGVDRYYMPFISPTVHRRLTQKEARELPYADSVPFTAVPQILTKVPEDFLWTAEQCRDRGYEEINLNTGCPSGTVFSKGKGAGMLADPDHLDRFLDAVFEKTPISISVKTRLGVLDPDEFPDILDVFNRYPIKELTLHPRVRKAFYKGDVCMDGFRYLLANSKNPVCYNGNLCSVRDISDFSTEFPQVQAVMIGRGLIGDPGMLTKTGTTPETLKAFSDALLDAYTEAFGAPRNAMFRLKENWTYLLCRFDGAEKLGKQLRKTTDVDQYRQITHQIIDTCPMLPELRPAW